MLLRAEHEVIMRQLLASLPGHSLQMCEVIGVNPVVPGRYAPFTAG